MCNASVAEASANRSEIQIWATESSSSTKRMITSIWNILPPSRLKGSDLSEGNGMWVAHALKMATNSLTGLPLRSGSVPLSVSGLACDCLDKWSMEEVMLCLFISLPF